MPTTHIRNLTDVDDKTIRDSQKAGVSLAEFTAGWVDLFHRDCAALNCLPPHAEPSAVGHIPEQIRMVQTLVEKGHAYVSEDGSVYFRISSFPEYGRLSHLDERELDLGKPPIPGPTQTNMKRLRGRLRAVEEPQAGRRKQLLALSLGRRPPRLAPGMLRHDP